MERPFGRVIRDRPFKDQEPTPDYANEDVRSIRATRRYAPARPTCYISTTNPITSAPMAQQSIFGPFFATMFLTLVVWVYMYVRRTHFITSNKIRPNDLAVPGALAKLSPAAVSNPSDNLKNLFEMPVLFYALALYLFVTSQVDAGYVYAGWTFVAFRALHSAVHCTFNLVLLRFWLYAVSTVALWFIVIRAAFVHFVG